jgi:hypothetical protein
MQITSSAKLDRQFELISEFSAARLVAIAKSARRERAGASHGAVSKRTDAQSAPPRTPTNA